MHRLLCVITCALLVALFAAAPATNPDSFTAQLPSGIRVAFLGVQPPHDTEKADWRSPDGNHVVTMPFRKPVVHFSGPQPQAHLAFELLGLREEVMKPLPGRPDGEPGDVTILPDLPSYVAYPWVETIGGKRRMFCIVDFSHRLPPTIPLIIAGGVWTSVAELKLNDTGTDINIKNDDPSINSTASFTTLTEKEGKTTAKFDDQNPDQRYLLRVIAIDAQNQEHRASGYSSGFPRVAGKPRAFSFTFDLPMAKVHSLKVAYRPYETVEFSNFALTADDRTEVQMTTVPTTQPSP